MAFSLQLPLDAPRRVQNTFILVVACAASCLDAINLSAVNIALPTIANDLGLTQSTVPWLIASYAIAFAAFLLPAGKLGDLFGYRLVFSTGLALFAITSLINAVSVNSYMLFVFRALQGLAAAARYDSDKQRNALGGFGGAGALGFVIGLILGGVLSATAGWRWIFYISAILSLVMFILATLFVPKGKPASEIDQRIDVLGFLMVIAGFILIVYALSDGQWHLARDPITLVLGVLLIVGFLVWQSFSSYPLLPPSLWRQTNFAASFTIGFFIFAVFNGIIYTTTLQFQYAFSYSALTTALYFIPAGIWSFVVAFGSAVVTPIVGSRWLIVIGAFLTAAAHVMANFFSPEIGFWRLIFPMDIVLTTGMPAVFVAAQNAMILRARPEEAATIGAVYNTASQLGSAVGLAIMTAVITGINKADATGLDLLAGYNGARYVGIGLCIIIMVVGFFFIKDDKPVDKVNDAERGSESEKESTESI